MKTSITNVPTKFTSTKRDSHSGSTRGLGAWTVALVNKWKSPAAKLIANAGTNPSQYKSAALEWATSRLKHCGKFGDAANALLSAIRNGVASPHDLFEKFQPLRNFSAVDALGRVMRIVTSPMRDSSETVSLIIGDGAPTEIGVIRDSELILDEYSKSVLANFVEAEDEINDEAVQLADTMANLLKVASESDAVKMVQLAASSGYDQVANLGRDIINSGASDYLSKIYDTIASVLYAGSGAADDALQADPEQSDPPLIQFAEYEEHVSCNATVAVWEIVSTLASTAGTILMVCGGAIMKTLGAVITSAGTVIQMISNRINSYTLPQWGSGENGLFCNAFRDNLPYFHTPASIPNTPARDTTPWGTIMCGSASEKDGVVSTPVLIYPNAYSTCLVPNNAAEYLVDYKRTDFKLLRPWFNSINNYIAYEQTPGSNPDDGYNIFDMSPADETILEGKYADLERHAALMLPSMDIEANQTGYDTDSYTAGCIISNLAGLAGHLATKMVLSDPYLAPNQKRPWTSTIPGAVLHAQHLDAWTDHDFYTKKLRARSFEDWLVDMCLTDDVLAISALMSNNKNYECVQIPTRSDTETSGIGPTIWDRAITKWMDDSEISRLTTDPSQWTTFEFYTFAEEAGRADKQTVVVPYRITGFYKAIITLAVYLTMYADNYGASFVMPGDGLRPVVNHYAARFVKLPELLASQVGSVASLPVPDSDDWHGVINPSSDLMIVSPFDVITDDPRVESDPWYTPPEVNKRSLFIAMALTFTVIAVTAVTAFVVSRKIRNHQKLKARIREQEAIAAQDALAKDPENRRLQKEYVKKQRRFQRYASKVGYSSNSVGSYAGGSITAEDLNDLSDLNPNDGAFDNCSSIYSLIRGTPSENE